MPLLQEIFAEEYLYTLVRASSISDDYGWTVLGRIYVDPKDPYVKVRNVNGTEASALWIARDVVRLSDA